MKKLFLLLFSVLAFTSQVRADVEWTIWEGSINMSEGSAGSWAKSLYLGSVNFSNIAVDDVIYLTCTKNDGADNANIYIYRQNYQKVGEVESWPETEMTHNTQSTENFAYTVTSDILTQIQDASLTNIAIKGTDYTLTKVSIKKSSSFIKTTLSSEEHNFGQWYNNYVVSRPLEVKSGDFLYLSATRQTGKYNDRWDGDKEKDINWWSVTFQDTENDEDKTWTYSINSFDHDVWKEIESSDVEEINAASNIVAKGQFYNCEGFYLYHPVNSFKIGSIGMATFSAAQKVKVPEGLTAYKATFSGNNVKLSPFTDNIIPADQGAIIEGPQGSVVEFVATSEASVDESDLQPVTTETAVTSLPSGYDYYVLYAGTGEKEDELALSTLLSAWGSWHPTEVNWNGETHTITYNGTASGEGGWVGADWSAYDKLKLNFSANTLDADATFYVAYNGHDDATTEATLTKGSTSSIEIELNSDYKNVIGNFSMWSNATSGSLTFKSAALIDNDGATVAEFRKIKTDSGTIAANKAYLMIAKDQDPGSKLNIVFAEDENKQGEEQQGETTSIRNMTNTNVNNNVVYNMNGQRVGSDYKGLVIVNGKKIIKK